MSHGLNNRRAFLKVGALSISTSTIWATNSGIASGLSSKDNIELAPSLNVSRLVEVINSAIETHSCPGLSLTIWQRGEEVYARDVGYANLETMTLVSRDSLFRIGSLSKQFTAAMVLKLAEQKLLSLDDNVKKHLPFFSSQQSFTIRELLHHTAGVHDADIDPRQIRASSQVELAKLISKQRKLFDFHPGTAWLYSNSNYFLLGAIIELITRQSLDEAGNALLFRPLKLSKISFDSSERILPNRVAGYSLSESTNALFINAGYEDMRLNGAAGGMVSASSDLCRWHHLLFNGIVLSSDSLSQMTAPGLLRNSRKASSNRFSPNDKMMGNVDYGMGLMIDPDSTLDGSPIFLHHGGVMGFSSMLVSHPKSGITFACLCNADSNPKLPFRDIRRAVFASVLK